MIVVILQSSIIASGYATYTVGETFPIMQNIKKDVSLSVPKYTIEEQPKIKPPTFWQKLKLIIKKLFR